VVYPILATLATSPLVFEAKGTTMPLTRISVSKTRPQDFGKKVAEIVSASMEQTVNVHPRDTFQVVTTHQPDELIFEPSILKTPQPHGITLIQITLSQGRAPDRKEALYKAIRDQLFDKLGVESQTVFINLVECMRENWSFDMR
jgi:4-oxalocrotonate tautomerase